MAKTNDFMGVTVDGLLSDPFKVKYVEKTADALEQGNLENIGSAAGMIGGVTIPIYFDADPDLANLLREDPSAFPGLLNSFIPFLEAIAEFTNFDILGLAKNPPIFFIDPTVLVTKINEFINDTATGFKDNISDKFREMGVSDKIPNLGIDYEAPEPLDVFEDIIPNLDTLVVYISRMLLGDLTALGDFLDFFGIKIASFISAVTDFVQDLKDRLGDLDLGRKARKEIRQLLAGILVELVGLLAGGFLAKVLEAVMSLVPLSFSIPTIALPAILTDIPTLSIDFFNIDIPTMTMPDFLKLPQPNIFSEILGFFQKIIDYFVDIFTNVDPGYPRKLFNFVFSLLEAVGKGIVGIIEFLLEIVIGIIQTAFSLEGFSTKKAAMLVIVSFTVKFLAIGLLGILFGEGEIFKGLGGAILNL